MRPTNIDRVKKAAVIVQAKNLHMGYVNMVVGNIKKYGYETVMQSYMAIHGPHGPYWLKQALERVLDFTEKVYLKELDKPLVDQSKHDTNITVVIEDENKITCKAGEGISKYIEV